MYVKKFGLRPCGFSVSEPIYAKKSVPLSGKTDEPMTDFRLKVFRSVARNLSFTKASQELYISQPAVSRHVQELEAAYRVQLFERSGGRIGLTDAGRILLGHCDRIIDEYDRLSYDMSLLNHSHEGELSVGASTTVAQYVLPPLMARFLDKFPRVALSLRSGNSREVEEALLARRIHVGLVEELAHHPSLRYTHFLRDELVAVVGAANPLGARDELSCDELRTVPLVLRENGSGTLEVIARALSEHNLRLSELNVRLHLGSTESIKLYLENSDCMGIVSVRAVRRELYDGRLRAVDISGLKMSRDFHIAEPQGAGEGLGALFARFLLRDNRSL